MAYIPGTAFWPLVTNHEFDSTLNITGMFVEVGHSDFVPALCNAGTLCKKETQVGNEGYEQSNINQINLYNKNDWFMGAVDDETTLVNTPIYACNPFDVNEVEDPITGALYRVGANTLGLPVPAGRLATFTRIDFTGDKIYRFGEGNFATTPDASNPNLIISTGGLLTAVDDAAIAALPNGTPYFEVLRNGGGLTGYGQFTEGAYAAGTYYDLVAKHVVA